MIPKRRQHEHVRSAFHAAAACDDGIDIAGLMRDARGVIAKAIAK